MNAQEKIVIIESKLKEAEQWFEANPDSPLFEKAFERFRELLRERAALYLKEQPIQKELFDV